MSDVHEMIVGTEESIKKYFPSRWTKKNAFGFANDAGYELDINSLNEGLNVPIRDFVFRGGKRFRPVLFLTCLDLFGLDYKKYFGYAAVIELIHNGTLILDDIEDRSVLRRSLPTLHLKFGLDIATNVGASLHFLPLKILRKLTKNLDNEQQLKIWDLVIQELINVSHGQALDIYWHNHKTPEEISVNKYLEMVSFKTGSLMRVSVVMACILAGKDEKSTELFRDFAGSLGMAFQIIDDCLDLNPPDEKFGKSIGNDITEGKLSLPVIYTLKRIEQDKRTELQKILKRHTRDKELIARAIDIINSSGSVAKAQKFAYELIEDSFQALENRLERNNLEKLQELAYLVVKRSY